MATFLQYMIWCIGQFFALPFAVQWRFVLVRLPWLVPRPALRFTSKTPHPILVNVPSRGERPIPVYVFLPPKPSKAGDVGAPVHLDFHGGGFFQGSCLEQAPFCSLLARQTGRIVLSVDYRMGPLHHFPDAIHDAEDILKAVLDSDAATPAGARLRKAIAKKWKTPATADLLDTTHISLSGFSSGGNLALNLAISTRTDDEKWPCLLPLAAETANPIPVLLFYPSLDQTTPEHRRKLPPRFRKEGHEDKESFWALAKHLGPTYLGPEQRRHVRANPGLADMRHGLHEHAAVLLVLPEIDSLAEQSDLWLRKMELEGRGKCVHVERVSGMVHGWTQFPDLFLGRMAREEKARVFDEAVKFLDRLGNV